MVNYCCICKSRIGEMGCISFHKLPKNETLKKKWFMAIGQEVNKRSGVCSRHFEESDFKYKLIKDAVRRFLKPRAYPTVLLTEHLFYRVNVTTRNAHSAVNEHSKKLKRDRQFSPNNDVISQDLPDMEENNVNETSSMTSTDAGTNITKTSQYLYNNENIENPLSQSSCNDMEEGSISEADYNLEQKPVVILDNTGTIENTELKSEFISEDWPESEKYNVDEVTLSGCSSGAVSNFTGTSKYVVKEENIENPFSESPCNDAAEESISEADYNLEQKPIIIPNDEGRTENATLKSEFISEDWPELEKYKVNEVTSSGCSSAAVCDFTGTSEYLVKKENIENRFGESPCNDAVEESISDADYNLEQKPIIISDDEETTDSATLKRQVNPPLTGARKFYHPRFIGDLRREDFTSDHAWKIVQKYFQDTKTKTKTLQRKVKRLTDKVKKLESRIR